jgi:GNAT superfamily N-acetyltransferase
MNTEVPTRSMSTTARWATPADRDFLLATGAVHLPVTILSRKITWQEIVIVEQADVPIGYLQLDYLWSIVPFIALIWVLEPYRKHGGGRTLLAFIEEHARREKHIWLYSSSQLDEPAPQAWHRHMGFEECGILAGHNGGIGEVFFRKRLR